eukprot:CAMPEP_0185830078 /NCGR_PEP_ID=MMETSP1353-20130828/618_1 /TAXON_ID=1077150 /ORGANISM="Erythrolobus australicus, Strain CCMP3124" /LENGTH=98 /DNA_ID=CAMNT_0028527935 /DNA_START=82 /DNA_END=378 /DNA_ORIENTATION=+
MAKAGAEESADAAGRAGLDAAAKEAQTRQVASAAPAADVPKNPGQSEGASRQVPNGSGARVAQKTGRSVASARLEKMLPRRAVDESEMEAIMLGGAGS